MVILVCVLSAVVVIAVLVLWWRDRSRLNAAVTHARIQTDAAHTEAQQLRDEAAAAQAELQHVRDELEHLEKNRLPAVLHGGVDPGPGVVRDGDWPSLVQQIVQRVFASSRTLDQRASQLATVIVRGHLHPLRSLSKQVQHRVDGLYELTEDRRVVQGLMNLDATIAVWDRRVQATMAVCGGVGWMGQQRSAKPLVDVITAAADRIREHDRVSPPASISMSVRPDAVEALALTMSELLDNATRFSPPTSRVQVVLEHEAHGVSIMVEDGATLMSDEELARARQMLDPVRPVDLSELGDPPRVGLAAVGALSAQAGFTVRLGPWSARGGMQATVFVPAKVLEISPDPTLTVTGDSSSASSREAGETASPTVPADRTDNGLPRRRAARHTQPASSRATQMHGSVFPEPEATESGYGNAAALGAFQTGHSKAKGDV